MNIEVQESIFSIIALIPKACKELGDPNNVVDIL